MHKFTVGILYTFLTVKLQFHIWSTITYPLSNEYDVIYTYSANKYLLMTSLQNSFCAVTDFVLAFFAWGGLLSEEHTLEDC